MHEEQILAEMTRSDLPTDVMELRSIGWDCFKHLTQDTSHAGDSKIPSLGEVLFLSLSSVGG